MALSNWDTMAFGPDGKPCTGEFVAHDGTSLEIYKNYLVVRKDSDILTINHGDIHTGQMHIEAIRGPQNSVFVLANSIEYKDEGSDTRRFAGIGCYGFDDNAPRLAEAMGIDLSEYHDYIEGGYYSPDGKSYETLHLIKNKGDKPEEKMIETTEYLESHFVGVARSTLAAFVKWIRSQIDDEFPDKELIAWLLTCKRSGALRFNQGDAFFLGENEAMTAVGEQKDETVFTQILDKVMPKDKE